MDSDRDPFDDSEYLEEDDDENKRDDLTSIQASLIRDIIKGDVHLDRDTDEEVSSFKAKYSSCLIGGAHGTVIHMALEQCRDSDFDAFKPLFLWSIRSNPSLLEERNQHGETILHFAIQKRLSKATKYLCTCAPDEATMSIAIGCRGQHMGNCVHSAIRLKLNVAMFLVNVCSNSALAEQDSFGNTPLHLAVDCGRGELKYNNALVATLIQRCPEAAYTLDNDGLSPYGRHFATGIPRKPLDSSTAGPGHDDDRRILQKRPRIQKSSRLHSETIEDLFKVLYLRNRSREDCLDLIYGQSKTEGMFTFQDCRVQFK